MAPRKKAPPKQDEPGSGMSAGSNSTGSSSESASSASSETDSSVSSARSASSGSSASDWCAGDADLETGGGDSQDPEAVGRRERARTYITHVLGPGFRFRYAGTAILLVLAFGCGGCCNWCACGARTANDGLVIPQDSEVDLSPDEIGAEGGDCVSWLDRSLGCEGSVQTVGVTVGGLVIVVLGGIWKFAAGDRVDKKPAPNTPGAPETPETPAPTTPAPTTTTLDDAKLGITCPCGERMQYVDNLFNAFLWSAAARGGRQKKVLECAQCSGSIDVLEGPLAGESHMYICPREASDDIHEAGVTPGELVLNRGDVFGLCMACARRRASPEAASLADPQKQAIIDRGWPDPQSSAEMKRFREMKRFERSEMGKTRIDLSTKLPADRLKCYCGRPMLKIPGKCIFVGPGMCETCFASMTQKLPEEEWFHCPVNHSEFRVASRHGGPADFCPDCAKRGAIAPMR